MQVSILFVCLGNICRSPMAEGAFRKAAEEAGLNIEMDSAATHNWHSGKEIDPRSQAVALRHGVDLSAKRARHLEEADFFRFTHIFALDQGNLNGIRQVFPDGAKAKVELLMDNVPGRKGSSVADPYFSEDSAFDITWSDVEAAAAALVKRFSR